MAWLARWSSSKARLMAATSSLFLTSLTLSMAARTAERSDSLSLSLLSSISFSS